MEQRAMPPKVMDQIVTPSKVLLVLFKQIDPFAPSRANVVRFDPRKRTCERTS